MIDIKGKKFDEIEYSALRSEQNMRIEMINEQGFKINSFIFTFYSALIAMLGFCFSFAGKDNTIFGKCIFIELLISTALTVFTSLPLYILLAFSGKYNDNLSQIVSISVYQKIFFELSSLTRKVSEKLLGWEFLHNNLDNSNVKSFDKEFKLLSIATVICITVISIAMSGAGFFLNRYFAQGMLNANLAAVIVYYILLAAYIGYMIYLAVKIVRNTNSKKLLNEFNNNHVKDYLDKAVEYKYITEAERAEFEKLLGVFKY